MSGEAVSGARELQRDGRNGSAKRLYGSLWAAVRFVGAIESRVRLKGSPRVPDPREVRGHLQLQLKGMQRAADRRQRHGDMPSQSGGVVDGNFDASRCTLKEQCGGGNNPFVE